MKKLKYYHYYPRALVGNGGPTVAMWSWIRALKAVGQDVKVFYDAELECTQPLACSDVEMIPVKHQLKGRWRYPVNISRYIDADSILIVHSAYLAGNLVAARAAEKNGAKVVYVPHGAYEHSARRRKAFLKKTWLLVETAFLQRALAVHAFVETERESIREVTGDAKIIVAPTPVSVSSEHIWKGGGGYIAWFGRYDIEHKGLDLFINAYRSVPKHLRMPVRLRGRDSTHTRHDVSVLIEKAGLSDVINAGPPVEGAEKMEFVCNAEFFVMPSRWESFSIALIEVLSLNIPCLVSNSMPISKKLSETGACVVSSLYDSALIDALVNILSKKTDLSLLRPQRYVREHLTHQVVGRSFVDQIESCYEQGGHDS